MTFGEGWQGVVISGVVYTAVAWTVIFIVRLIFVAPFQMWREQKDRADQLEGLRQIAADASRPPSFDLGFEFSPFDPKEERLWDHRHHPLCRVWVENLEHRPLEDCRVVIESITPATLAVRNGALLLPDERSEETVVGVFHLAPTQKRYFSFLEIDQSIWSIGRDTTDKQWELVIRSDQEDATFARVLHPNSLSFGQRYFVALAVHGKNAGSRRLNLVIDAMSAQDTNVRETKTGDCHERSDQTAL